MIMKYSLHFVGSPFSAASTAALARDAASPRALSRAVCSSPLQLDTAVPLSMVLIAWTTLAAFVASTLIEGLLLS